MATAVKRRRRRAALLLVNPTFSFTSHVHSNMAATVECGSDSNAAVNNMSLKKALKAASPLTLRIVAECPVTKARACDLMLPHCTVSTPVFMPVGTQGTLKGITVDQLEGLGCQICLGNTYHLGMRPVGNTKIIANVLIRCVSIVFIWINATFCIVNVFSMSTLLSTGVWFDRESQWFAWIHELEEKSFNCEWSLFYMNKS